MNLLQIVVGRQCMAYKDKIDDQMVSRADRSSSLTNIKARQSCQEELIKKEEYWERTEELLYGPGIADYLVSRCNHKVSVSKLCTRFS